MHNRTNVIYELEDDLECTASIATYKRGIRKNKEEVRGILWKGRKGKREGKLGKGENGQ